MRNRNTPGAARGSVAAEDPADDAAGPAGRGRLRGRVRGEVWLERVRQVRQRHGLQPDLARAGERHQVEPVAAEQLVGDARHLGDAELHLRLEHADVTRVHEQRLARLQRVGGQLAGQLDPRPALTVQPLQDEALAAPQAAAERLLQADARGHARRAAQPAALVHEERLPVAEVHRHDVAGQLRRERHHARAAAGLEAGQEDPAAADGALEPLHEAAATAAGARGLRHLHIRRHPRQLAVRGDELLPRLEVHLEHRHRAALDFGLHPRSPPLPGRPALPPSPGIRYSCRPPPPRPRPALARAGPLLPWTIPQAAGGPMAPVTFTDTQTWYAGLPTMYGATAALITDPAGRVLLVKPNYRELWSLPGGILEQGEPPHAGCVREVAEETGLQITAGPLL